MVDLTTSQTARSHSTALAFSPRRSTVVILAISSLGEPNTAFVGGMACGGRRPYPALQYVSRRVASRMHTGVS